MTRTLTRDGASAPLRYVRHGGPRPADPAPLPGGAADRQHRRPLELPLPELRPCFRPRPQLDAGGVVTESTAPDGTPELRETQIVNVTEVEFDPDVFSADPSLGFRVEDLWDVLTR